MASFRKSISNKYGVKTYQETKNTYDWINKAIHKGPFPAIKINSEFSFSLSDIHCDCNGIEQFVENAYGQTNYDLTTMNLSIYSEDFRIAFIIVKFDNSISISTESKVMLEQIVTLLEATTLDETEVDDPISVTYIETQINNDGILIQGDNNTVANDHSSVNISSQKQVESKIKQWFYAILQNLLANGVWYLLCLVVGAAIALYASR